MREILEANLQDLGTGFLRMQGILVEQITLVRDAVQTGSLAGLGDRVKGLDRQIDELETELENRVLRVIALQQPVASDLRRMMLVLKSLADIERAGDYISHVARNAEHLETADRADTVTDLLPLLTQLIAMAERVGRAFGDRDPAAAREAIAMDDVIDTLYEQMQRVSVTRILEAPHLIGTSLELSSLARSAERCGDHLVNVAERVELTFGPAR